MNKRINFSQLDGLAIYQDTLDFMQTSYRDAIKAITSVIGNNVIVNGVLDQSTTYSDGWVIIGDELMPFVGGLKAAQVIVEEITGTEIFSDDSSKTVYYTKRARLGTIGGVEFVNFIRLDSLQKLKEDVATADQKAVNAQASANNANANAETRVSKDGDTMTGSLSVSAATDNAHAVNYGQMMSVFTKDVYDTGVNGVEISAYGAQPDILIIPTENNKNYLVELTFVSVKVSGGDPAGSGTFTKGNFRVSNVNGTLTIGSHERIYSSQTASGAPNYGIQLVGSNIRIYNYYVGSGQVYRARAIAKVTGI